MKITQYRYEKEQLVMRTLELFSLVESLRRENKNRPVTTLRENLPYMLAGKWNKYEQRLPQLVFGAVYKKMETEAEVRNYTGLTVLQVNDLASGSEAAAIRLQASRMPQTLLAFIGADGRSVKIIVPFTLPDGSLPKKLELAELFHAHAYRQAVKYYQPELKYNITLIEPDVEQSCRMSYDPDLYYNPDAVAIRMEQPGRMPDKDTVRIIPQVPESTDQRLMPGMSRNYVMGTRYSVAFVEAAHKVGKLGDDGMQQMLVELAQNCYKADLSEEDAVRWTLLYEDMLKYELDIRQTFRSVYELKNKIGKKHACGLPEIISLSLLLEEFMKRRYELRRNTMTGEVEFRDRSLVKFTFDPLTKEVSNSMCLEAHKEGLNIWDKDIDRYLHSNRVAEFHPLKAYLERLPVWDGTDRIRQLANRVKCDNDKWAEYFYRWFLGMVAHWLQMDKEHGNSAVPLLVGNQGCGKSTFCLQLLPPELRMFYTDSIDFSSRRETELALTRYLLINIDEFETVKPGQQSYVKHVLQKAVVNTRMPYQSSVRQMQRYGAFIATANNFDLLTDPTGSRRFICVEVQETIDTVQPIDYEQLLSQTLDLLKQGERYWFTREEEAKITADNARFQQIPVEEQYFRRYFTAASTEDEGEELVTTEIMERIRQKNKSFVYSNKMLGRFGRVLKRLNIPCRRTKRGNCYRVVELLNS